MQNFGFLRKLISHTNNDFGKINTSSLSLQKNLDQNLIKCFTNFIPINMIQNVVNEDDSDLMIEEISKNIEKSETDMEIFESIEELIKLQVLQLCSFQTV